MRFFAATAAAFIAVVAACSSTKGAESAPPSSTTEAPPAEAPAPWADGSPVVFEELPDDLKGRFMKEVVVPKMQPLFQAHDPKEFAEFGCKTCHGEDAKARHFEMPAPDIHVLSMSTMMKKDKEEHPNTFKFMQEVVVPEMAKLLGEAPYDPATNKGFGCMECHTTN